MQLAAVAEAVHWHPLLAQCYDGMQANPLCLGFFCREMMPHGLEFLAGIRHAVVIVSAKEVTFTVEQTAGDNRLGQRCGLQAV